MSTKTIIYRFCIAKEDSLKREQKILKKELKKRFKNALRELDKASSLEDQQTILNAIL